MCLPFKKSCLFLKTSFFMGRWGNDIACRHSNKIGSRFLSRFLSHSDFWCTEEEDQDPIKVLSPLLSDLLLSCRNSKGSKCYLQENRASLTQPNVDVKNGQRQWLCRHNSISDKKILLWDMPSGWIGNKRILNISEFKTKRRWDSLICLGSGSFIFICRPVHFKKRSI